MRAEMSEVWWARVHCSVSLQELKDGSPEITRTVDKGYVKCKRNVGQEQPLQLICWVLAVWSH